MMEKHLMEIPLQQGETAHKTANSYARAIVQSMSYILESQSRETDVRLLGILNEMLDLYLRVQEKEYELNRPKKLGGNPICERIFP